MSIKNTLIDFAKTQDYGFYFKHHLYDEDSIFKLLEKKGYIDFKNGTEVIEFFTGSDEVIKKPLDDFLIFEHRKRLFMKLDDYISRKVLKENYFYRELSLNVRSIIKGDFGMKFPDGVCDVFLDDEEYNFIKERLKIIWFSTQFNFDYILLVYFYLSFLYKDKWHLSTIDALRETAKWYFEICGNSPPQDYNAILDLGSEINYTDIRICRIETFLSKVRSQQRDLRDHENNNCYIEEKLKQIKSYWAYKSTNYKGKYFHVGDTDVNKLNTFYYYI